MAFRQKTWTDRISEYINRRLLTKKDGSTELVTVTREEGVVAQEGDSFCAETMNDLERRIADEFSQVLYIVSFDKSSGILVTKSADYTEGK
jgi:hypothetical protein